MCWLLVRGRIPSSILRWKNKNSPDEVLPSGRVVPSDQGIYKTCTRHALGKAIVDGFQNRVFDSREIDFDQDKVTDVLIKMDPGLEMTVSDSCGVKTVTQDICVQWEKLSHKLRRFRRLCISG